MKKKYRVKNPIAHADGGVSEGFTTKIPSNNTLTKTATGGTKTLVENEEAKIRRNYKPVVIDYIKLPDFVLPEVNDWQKRYLYKFKEGAIPSEFVKLTSGNSSIRILECIELDPQKEGAKGLQVVSKFAEAYKKGYIKEIVDTLNAKFKTPDWYLEKNFDKYYQAANSTYLWELICQFITATKLDITNETTLQNVRMLVLAYFNAPQKMGQKMYEGVNATSKAYYEQLRKAVAGFSVWDIVTLGLTQVAEETTWLFVSDLYNKRINTPNRIEYERFTEEMKTAKTYDKTLKQAINDISPDNKEYLEGKQFEGKKLQGDGQNSANGEEGDSGAEERTSIDPTIYVAIGILVLIFVLKRKKNR